MLNESILKLSIDDFYKCGNIWNIEKQAELACRFYNELCSGNRSTYIYTINGEFIGEISLVLDMGDYDYTIAGQRIYVSRLIVKPEYRRRGIGKCLVQYAVELARKMNYAEMSIGVDLDNYPALKLYADLGFDKIIYADRDEQGEYLKLLKTL